MKTISIAKLVELLLTIEKPTFVNLITETKVRMNKTGNPYFDKVFKIKKGNYLIGTMYENRVNNNLVKEDKKPNFKAKENNVGEHIGKVLLFNQNTNKYYLQHERFDNSNIETRYVFEGKDITEDQFKPFMPSSNNYENQNLNNTVKVLSVTLDNIKVIAINGTTYVVTK